MRERKANPWFVRQSSTSAQPSPPLGEYFFFFKQKTAYEMLPCLEFRRVLFRSRGRPQKRTATTLPRCGHTGDYSGTPAAWSGASFEPVCCSALTVAFTGCDRNDMEGSPPEDRRKGRSGGESAHRTASSRALPA